MEKHKILDACDEEILRDPFLTEATWLPSCKELSSSIGSGTQSKKKREKLKSAFAWFLPIVVAACVSAGGFYTVHLGFDWGYYLVQKICGQSHGMNQGVMAGIILISLVAPLFFGMVLSTFASVRKLHWNKTMPIISALLLAEYQFIHIGSSLVETVICLIVSLIAFYTGFFFTGKAISNLRVRIKMAPIYASCAFSFVVTGLFSFFWTGHGGTLREILLFAISLFVTGWFSCNMAKVRNETSAVVVPLLAVAPLVVANVVNVTFTTVSYLLDRVHFGFDLGWEACLSAYMIAFVSFLASSAGGLLELYWSRHRQAKGTLRLG